VLHSKGLVNDRRIIPMPLCLCHAHIHATHHGTRAGDILTD